MNPDHIAHLLLALVGGGIAGASGFWIFHKIKLGNYQKIAKDIILKGENEAETIRKAAELATKQMQVDHQRELEQVWQIERKKIQREEDRLKQREDKLEARMSLVEEKTFGHREKRGCINWTQSTAG